MEVKEISTEQTYELRQRILRAGMPLAACKFPADTVSVHFGVFRGQRLVSVLSAHPENSPLFPSPGQWRIRGMATDEEFQGKGYGGAGLDVLLSWGKAKGLPMFWCNAREGAIPFYLRHGFVVASDLFDIPTAGPHKVMWVKL
ncbi:MAG: GNAT family N-acetyltransferase [Bdellovibrionota bacterium]